jgi:hypothetical protein
MKEAEIGEAYNTHKGDEEIHRATMFCSENSKAKIHFRDDSMALLLLLLLLLTYSRPDMFF